MNTHTTTEDTMIAKLLNFFRRTKQALAAPYEPCSYDCYDAGGCENCSDWIEFWDADYGDCGHWQRRGTVDPLPLEIIQRTMKKRTERIFNEPTKLDFMAELAEAERLHSIRYDGYCECGAHVRGTDCYMIGSFTDTQLLNHTWTLGDRRHYPTYWQRAMKLSEEAE